jgi:thiamine-monophosphate kinase
MAFPPDATLSDAGEFELIEALTGVFEQGEHVLVGPGDDAAVLRVKTGHVVVSTDLMVEGRHFRRDWVAAEDVGHRAAAQNLSDINAMGGRATSLTIGLAAPADLPVQWALDFAKGFADECALVGASIVGGDLTRADQVMIAVTVLGACTVAPVLRSGARPGDVLAITGRQGWAAGGMAVLGRGFRSPRVLVEAYRRPEPPYDAGQVAADAGATAMIDVSDGLLGCSPTPGTSRPTPAWRSTSGGRRSRSRSPSPPSAPPSARTRSRSSSAVVTTTPCWRRSPRGRCRRGGP